MIIQSIEPMDITFVFFLTFSNIKYIYLFIKKNFKKEFFYHKNQKRISLAPHFI